jgi:hypothetical protein
MALTVDQTKKFDEALRDAFRTREDLEKMVFYHAGKRLNEVVGSGGLKNVMFKLIQEADAGGWVKELYAGALKEAPQNERLRRVGPILGFASAPQTALGLQLTNTSDFDLSELEEVFLQKLSAEGPGGDRLIGLSVGYGEPVFVTNFTDRMRRLLGRESTEVRPPIPLNPRMGSPARSVELASRYRTIVDRSNLVCQVPAEEADQAAIETFWNAVSAACNGLSNFFVLLFTAVSGTVFPQAVTELPMPQFKDHDLTKWTFQIADSYGWPRETAFNLAHWIREQSLDEENQNLDIRFVYETLDSALRDLQQDSVAFLEMMGRGK